MPQIVWTAIPTGEVDYCNRRWYEFTGLSEAEGSPNWQPIVHPDDLTACLESWGESVATGKNYETEYRFRDKTGEYKWYLGRAVAGRNEMGEIVRWYGSCTDIDEYKRIQAANEQRARELVEFNAKLSRSNQELDDFAYVASHDLREPLRGISNYSSFLIEDYGEKLDADGCAKLHTLQHLSQRLDSLIDSMLEFSRVGRVEMALQETDLNQIVEGILDSLRILIDERKIEIRILRPLPTIKCDHVRTARNFSET